MVKVLAISDAHWSTPFLSRNVADFFRTTGQARVLTLFKEDEEAWSSMFIACSTTMEDGCGVVKAEELGAIGRKKCHYLGRLKVRMTERPKFPAHQEVW